MTMEKALPQRVQVHLEGLKELPEVAAKLPVTPEEIKALFDEVTTLNAKQEQLKADLHLTTQALLAKSRDLNTAFQRNLFVAKGLLGKKDKAIEKLGGTIGLGGGGRRRSANPPAQG